MLQEVVQLSRLGKEIVTAPALTKGQTFFKSWQACWKFISNEWNVQKHPCKIGARCYQCGKGSELFLTLINLTVVNIFL